MEKERKSYIMVYEHWVVTLTDREFREEAIEKLGEPSEEYYID